MGIREDWRLLKGPGSVCVWGGREAYAQRRGLPSAREEWKGEIGSNSRRKAQW